MQALLSSLDRIKYVSRDWFVARAQGAHARAWLAALSFTESSFFLIAPDVLLIAILMVDGRRWLYYGLLTTFWSVLGALFGYVIGAFFYDSFGKTLIELYHFSDEMAYAQNLFDRHTFWIMFTAAFTPIPYKVFVLAGGFLKVNLFWFIVAGLLGRGLRFVSVAYITKVFGSAVAALIFRYFNYITFAVAGALLFIVLLFLF